MAITDQSSTKDPSIDDPMSDIRREHRSLFDSSLQLNAASREESIEARRLIQGPILPFIEIARTLVTIGVPTAIALSTIQGTYSGIFSTGWLVCYVSGGALTVLLSLSWYRAFRYTPFMKSSISRLKLLNTLNDEHRYRLERLGKQIDEVDSRLESEQGKGKHPNRSNRHG